MENDFLEVSMRILHWVLVLGAAGDDDLAIVQDRRCKSFFLFFFYIFNIIFIDREKVNVKNDR